MSVLFTNLVVDELKSRWIDVNSYHRDALVRQSIVILALLNEIAYEYRGNTTHVIQEKTALIGSANLANIKSVFNNLTPD